MSQPPARTLTWIYRYVAVRRKKMVFLPFVTSNVEWLESEWKHRGADVLRQKLKENVETSRLEKSSLSSNLVEVTLKMKLLSQPPWMKLTFEGMSYWVKNCGENPIGLTPAICKDRKIILMISRLFGKLQVCSSICWEM